LIRSRNASGDLITRQRFLEHLVAHVSHDKSTQRAALAGFLA
jgi:hypothetical protein